MFIFKAKKENTSVVNSYFIVCYFNWKNHDNKRKVKSMLEKAGAKMVYNTNSVLEFSFEEDSDNPQLESVTHIAKKSSHGYIQDFDMKIVEEW